ncbi:zinc-binding dehydrogenase [Enterobacter cloacae]|uniref:zinc-binding dehydrogenase n=2 Tax=Enterobacter TaxID=547 RepID=UPI001F4F94ED|nr:zinc-binding dehydrogenase [Enterobacter cloacae]
MLRRGESVLIQAAAGGVGLAAVQLVSQAGARVIAVASGTQRINRFLELGADHVVDRVENNVVDSVREYTRGAGVDLVIAPVGTTLQASLSALAPEGRLVFVGNAGGGSLTVDLWPPMQSNQALMGGIHGALFERPGVRTSVDDMLHAVAAGRIRVVIDRIFPLANAAAAHEFAETAKPLGRIVMKT